jgi:hypothetical protein
MVCQIIRLDNNEEVLDSPPVFDKDVYSLKISSGDIRVGHVLLKPNVTVSC